jgi:hypothetical protein
VQLQRIEIINKTNIAVAFNDTIDKNYLTDNIDSTMIELFVISGVNERVIQKGHYQIFNSSIVINSTLQDWKREYTETDLRFYRQLEFMWELDKVVNDTVFLSIEFSQSGVIQSNSQLGDDKIQVRLNSNLKVRS